ncbi:MAG: acyl-CoA thioesterase domain-containing protein [Thermodesulfobacteriota bacterium]
MSDTLFATLMEKIENPGEKTHLHVPDDWMQGRTVYGGLVAALALKAMRAHVSPERKIRGLFISFIGPLDARPVHIHTRHFDYRWAVDSAERGYVHERSSIWDPEGHLAVFSLQTNTVFA